MSKRRDGSPEGFSDRVILILETVAAADGGIGIQDLATELSLPQATVHRIATRLEEQRLLARDSRSRHFFVGPRLLQLSFRSLETSARFGPRRAILREVTQSIGESTGLGVLDADEVVYIDSIESGWPLALHFKAGVRVPLHCTSIGKLFLAYMSPPQREALIKALKLERFTRNTVTDRKTLTKLVQQIEKQGFAVTRNEYVDGVVGVAVPVFGPDRRMWAGLSVRAPEVRLTVERAQSLVPALRSAAERLSQLMTTN